MDPVFQKMLVYHFLELKVQIPVGKATHSKEVEVNSLEYYRLNSLCLDRMNTIVYRKTVNQ